VNKALDIEKTRPKKKSFSLFGKSVKRDSGSSSDAKSPHPPLSEDHQDNTSAPTQGATGLQQDWDQRTWLQNMAADMYRIASFLQQFEMTTRTRLSLLNTKLDHMERQLDQLEGRYYTFEQMAK